MNRKQLTDNKTGLEYFLTSNDSKKLIILFHGYGANMKDLWGLNEMIDNHTDYDWIFPNGPVELMHVMPDSRAWFNIDIAELEAAMAHGRHRSYRDKYPEDFAKVLTIVTDFVKGLQSKYDEIILGGFSQGAMMATHLTFNTDIPVKALLCFSGTLIGEKVLEQSSQINSTIPVFQSHGKQDPILAFEDARLLSEFLKLHGHQTEFVAFDGTHEIPYQAIQKWNKFMHRLSS